MHTRWVLLLSWMAILVFNLPTYAENPFTFEQHGQGIKVHLNNVLVMEHVWADKDVSRPYFKQLKTADGIQVSRTYPPDPVADKGNDDHGTYHPGAWMAFGDVNGNDYWRNKARVRFVGIIHDDTINGFTLINHYLDQNNNTLFEEVVQYEFSVEEHGYLIRTWSTFQSANNNFAFGDQEEMGFGVRLATDLRVRGGNGAMRNSEGGINEAGTWGKSADWLAGYGTVKEQDVGMMVLADPANFRKSWFHSRDYGLIVANPFGKKAMTGPKDDAIKNDSTLVQKGEKFTVGFGVYVFNYDAEKEPDFEEMYAEYTKRLSAN